jgi:hypothetical protein
MKTNFTLTRILLLTCISLLSFSGYAQLTNGGFHANFGVDADTKSDYIKYGSVTGNIKSDDWFATSGTSKGVIDTTNAAYYKALLKNNQNIAFVKVMSAPLYTKLNNTMWLDAVYCRDYIKLDSNHVDTTAFTTSCKNAGDPTTWLGGAAGVSNKNDLLDVYTHMRRNGTTITDSLWLFTAASTTGTSGSRYYDVELFKNPFTFNGSTGAFTSAGPEGGHATWKFDAAGNVTETGDLIIAITYNPGSAPVIEVRIWVARTTFNTLTPALFKFNGLFDANTNASPYGYASIVSKSGNTAFGAGAGNYTATATDTTYSTPWGTTTSTWDANYQPLQLVEIGLNLTRIGLDPSLYPAIASQSCGSFFKSIFYKSRSSASFSSNLNDFVGPLDFMRLPVLDHTIKSDTLSCRKTVGALKVTSNTTAALYQWKTPAGITMSGTSIAVTKPGTYILSSTIATGCGVGKTDTIVVLADSLKPVATANLAADMYGQVQLFGGDPVASNYPTRFGGSKGLTYAWTGPSGFTSTQQNPYINTWGQYNITVTELRNGCTSTATIAAMMSILADHDLLLKGRKLYNQVNLEWNKSTDAEVISYEVERATGGNRFTTIGTVNGKTALSPSQVMFTDVQPGLGTNAYRVKETSLSGSISYSNIVVIQPDANKNENGFFTHSTDQDKWYLVLNAASVKTGSLFIYSVSGQLLSVQKINLMKGRNVIEIMNKNLNNPQVKIGAVSVEKEMIFSSSFQ